MADVKISALPASTTPLAGTEVLPIVQSGTTVQVSVANLTAGRAIGATNATFTGALSVTPTWNAGATVFTGIGLNVTDTASAAGSLLLDLQVGGVSRFIVDKAGGSKVLTAATTGTYFNDGGAGLIGFYHSGTRTGYIFGQSSGVLEIAATNTQPLIFVAGSSGFRFDSGGGQAFIATDAANTLAQRNGVNAQTFRLYNTYTDASNYERGRVAWETNTFVVGAQAAGTGTQRTTYLTSNGNTSAAQVRIGTDAGGGRIWFTPANLSAWEITSSGHFLAGVDNTYDIGASGATRPRNTFIAGYNVSGVVAVASLPAAATAGAGARMFVNNALTPVFGSAVTGGGAVTVPVYSDGSAWNVG